MRRRIGGASRVAWDRHRPPGLEAAPARDVSARGGPRRAADSSCRRAPSSPGRRIRLSVRRSAALRRSGRMRPQSFAFLPLAVRLDDRELQFTFGRLHAVEAYAQAVADREFPAGMGPNDFTHIFAVRIAV